MIEAEKSAPAAVEPKIASARTRARSWSTSRAKLEVHVHVRPKYACRYCKDGVASPPPPVRPIARGIAGPGLIAQIVVAKFGDHLPLYRQEDFFTRHGLHIPRSTLCDWVQAAAELLRPLYERQKELVLQSPVLWTDDTPVTVLVGGQEGSRQGRFWTYIAEEHPYSVYDFTESRARDGPAKFLTGFQGYLHADAYGGYDQIYLGSNDAIRRSGLLGTCAAQVLRRHRTVHRAMHTRSWSGSGSCTTSKSGPASYRPMRGVRSVWPKQMPVLDRIGARLAELKKRALPKSALGKAVWYASNQWQALLPLHRGWSAVDRQQRQRTNAASPGDREKELVVPGQRASRTASGRLVHDPRRRQASPDRTVDLPARAAAPPARRRSTSR